VARAAERGGPCADRAVLADELYAADVDELAIAPVRLPDDRTEALFHREVDVLFELGQLRHRVAVADDRVVDAVFRRPRIFDRDAVIAAVERREHARSFVAAATSCRRPGLAGS